jgi:hypothetical protein
VLGRIVNRSGPGSQPLIVQTNPVPYLPVSLDTTKSRLVSRVAESTRGEVIGETVIAPTDWAWATCDAGKPFPGAPSPTQICLKNGFDAAKLYQVVYTSADAYALGVGFAAWRDVGVFFKTARADDTGTPNPVAGLVTHSIGRGVSQSGNFLRGWLHLGFNRDENGKQVHDGLWPIIAGRRIALNFPLGAARRRARALPGLAAKVRSGGYPTAIPCAADLRRASSIAARRPTLAPRSSSTSAPRKYGR